MDNQYVTDRANSFDRHKGHIEGLHFPSYAAGHNDAWNAAREDSSGAEPVLDPRTARVEPEGYSLSSAPFDLTNEAQCLCGELLTLLGATNLPVADKAAALRRVACLLDGGPSDA